MSAISKHVFYVKHRSHGIFAGLLAEASWPHFAGRFGRTFAFVPGQPALEVAG